MVVVAGLTVEGPPSLSLGISQAWTKVGVMPWVGVWSGEGRWELEVLDLSSSARPSPGVRLGAFLVIALEGGKLTFV